MASERTAARRARGVLIACGWWIFAGCAEGAQEPLGQDTERSPIETADGAAGEGETDEGEGQAIVAGNGDLENGLAGSAAPATGSFGEVYAILAGGCAGGRAGCHVQGASAMLALPDAAFAYERLVGAASLKCAGEMLVVPGDAGASILVMALEGGSECVKRMPLGRAPLAEPQIALIRTWIDDGAHFE